MVYFNENFVINMVPVEVGTFFFATSFVFDTLGKTVLKAAAGAAGCRVESVPYGITVSTLPVGTAIGFPAALWTKYPDISHGAGFRAGYE